jgi:hypothetical protein
MNRLETEFQDYIATAFDHQSLSKIQLQELRRAFMAGAVVHRMLTREQGESDEVLRAELTAFADAVGEGRS